MRRSTNRLGLGIPGGVIGDPAILFHAVGAVDVVDVEILNVEVMRIAVIFGHDANAAPDRRRFFNSTASLASALPLMTECDDCIRVIMGEDFAEVRALFGHRLGPSLAESDPVSLANSSQNGLLTFFSHNEVVARDGAPA
jgi:hypothetical protein